MKVKVLIAPEVTCDPFEFEIDLGEFDMEDITGAVDAAVEKCREAIESAVLENCVIELGEVDMA